MGMEGPPRQPKPVQKIEQKKAVAPQPPTAKVFEGEVLGPNAEDPRVLGRFEELPSEYAERWKRMPTNLRRMVIGDEEILSMTYDKLHEMSLRTSEEYAALQPLQELSGDDNKEYRGGDPALFAKDITPKPIRPEIEGDSKKLLGDK